MDKARHPNVIRTWTVERTKVPYRQPQATKLQSVERRAFFRASQKSGPRTGPAPKATE